MTNEYRRKIVCEKLKKRWIDEIDNNMMIVSVDITKDKKQNILHLSLISVQH